MKITVDPKVLADAVAWTAHALAARSSVPVLGGILLEANPAGLTLAAFDYDVSRRCTVAADITDPGKVLVPGRVLAEIAKALPNKPVEIYLFDGREIVITCGSTTFSLLTMPAEDYPTLPATPDDVGTVDAQVFAAAVGQVVRGVSADSSLPMLTGIRVDIDGDVITLASTDRYRMVSRTVPWTPVSPDFTAGVLIPGRDLQEITKSLPPGESTISLGDKGLAVFRGGGRTATVRLVDEEFVEYRERLAFTDCKVWAEVDKAEFVRAVKRVSLMAERHTPARFSFSDGELVVQAGAADVGRASEALEADLVGAPVEIAFNPAYLLDGLAGVDGGRVRLGLPGPIVPALIVGTEEDPDYRYLIMPIRTST